MIFSKTLKNIYKTRFSRKAKFYREEERILKLGRYKFGESNIFGDTINFSDGVTFLLGGKEILLKEIYKFKSITDSPYIIDCGSNIGLSVIYFKRLFPKSIISAYEPDPKIYSILKKNIEMLGYENVEIEKKAIWVNNNGVCFSSEGGFSGRIAYKGDHENIIDVPTQRLKDLLNRKVDLLKIDIEGAENEVFFDIQESLVNVDRIFLEYHSYATKPQTLHNILRILNEKGYRYHITEAFSRDKPFVDTETMVGMDLQINIYACRD